ncbi:O-methyltransferase [Gracilaria domingensis]|nr:O-methyltransferase [Gracilaria domingensis]
MDETKLDSTPLMRLGMAFAGSRVFLTAVELDLFTALDSPLTAEQICQKLGLHPRAVPDFTDALVALKVIERDGDGPQALYKNSPSSAAFLSKSSSTYKGGILVMCAKRLYKYWGHLTEALHTGQAQNQAHARNKGDGQVDWREMHESSDMDTQGFADAMTSMNTDAHVALAERFNFSEYRSLYDCGGASGQLCCEIVKKNPHIKAVSMDVPAVLEFAKKNIEKQNLKDNVEAVAGDFWNDAYPESDIITMGMILHNNDLEKKKILIKKAYDALPERGVFIAIDMIIDNERRENLPGLLMSLNMLIELGSAFDYTSADFNSWVTEIGFRRAEALTLVPPISACIAYK